MLHSALKKLKKKFEIDLLRQTCVTTKWAPALTLLGSVIISLNRVPFIVVASGE